MPNPAPTAAPPPRGRRAGKAPPGAKSAGPRLDRLRAVAQTVPENTRTIVVTAAHSVAAALAAIAFMVAVNGIYGLTLKSFAALPPPLFLAASFATVLGTSLVAGWLLFKLDPSAAGSGIPQLKAAYWKELGYVPIRPVLVKFLAGVLSVGGGTSLGREGPTMFISGGAASYLSGFTGTPKRSRRGAVVVGASAGLAAAFNAPLAAITFVLEEIVGDISSRSIGRVVLSSVIGAFTVYALIGRQPAFVLPPVEAVSWIHYLLVPVVAAAAAFLGIQFQKRALALRARVKRVAPARRWLMPAAGGLATWAVGSTVFLSTGRLGVFSLGYDDLSAVLGNHFVWWIAGILLVAKLAATIVSYGCGGCGGIFSPTLFIGGMCGYFIAGLAGLELPLTGADRVVLSAVGMSACLGTVVRAPLSSLLIVFEMTHQFSLVPSLLLGMFASMLVARFAGSENFYDALLLQDGHELHKIRPPQDLHGWRNLPVSAVAGPAPVALDRLDPAYLREVLDRHPYGRFPVVVDGTLRGMAARAELERALKSGAPPKLSPAAVCAPDRTVLEATPLFLESPDGAVLLAEEGTGRLVGIATLHDLLRAQAALAD